MHPVQPASIARPTRAARPRLRRDQSQTIVHASGLYWSVTGEAEPNFIATDIRLVSDDGSESAENLIDQLAPSFVEHLEELVADELH